MFSCPILMRLKDGIYRYSIVGEVKSFNPSLLWKDGTASSMGRVLKWVLTIGRSFTRMKAVAALSDKVLSTSCVSAYFCAVNIWHKIPLNQVMPQAKAIEASHQKWTALMDKKNFTSTQRALLSAQATPARRWCRFPVSTQNRCCRSSGQPVHG